MVEIIVQRGGDCGSTPFGVIINRHGLTKCVPLNYTISCQNHDRINDPKYSGGDKIYFRFIYSFLIKNWVAWNCFSSTSEDSACSCSDHGIRNYWLFVYESKIS